MVDVGLEVEVFTQHVLALLLRWRTRGNYFFQLRNLKLETQFFSLQRLYVLFLIINLSRYLLLLDLLLILINVDASHVTRLQYANYLLVIVLTEIVDEDCYYFFLQFDLGYCLACALPVFEFYQAVPSCYDGHVIGFSAMGSYLKDCMGRFSLPFGFLCLVVGHSPFHCP